MFNTELESKIRHTRLAAVIVQRSGGKISVAEAMEVARGLDLGLRYKVKVTNNWQEFQTATTLIDHEFEHSWAGYETVKETGRLLFTDGIPDEFKFGSQFDYQYSDNGNSQAPDEKYWPPEFEIEKRYVVVVFREERYHFNGEVVDKDINTIFVYTPSAEPILDQQTKALLELMAGDN